MLAHTWILNEYLGTECLAEYEADLFAYNVLPDILPICEGITPSMTHDIDRFRVLPDIHKKVAFIQFHLLVDDLAHYGRIGKRESKGFNPLSKGYMYVKGRSLVEPIIDFYRLLGEEIDMNLAAYRAHILIEMTFDQILRRDDKTDHFLTILNNGLKFALEERTEEVVVNLSWAFGIEAETIHGAVGQMRRLCNYERMNHMMNMEGRIGLCMNKFGLDCKDQPSRAGVKDLFACGMSLVTDYMDFLQPTLKAIKDSGFTNPL